MTLGLDLQGGGVLLAAFIAGAYCGYLIPFGYWEWRRLSRITRRRIYRWLVRSGGGEGVSQ